MTIRYLARQTRATEAVKRARKPGVDPPPEGATSGPPPVKRDYKKLIQKGKKSKEKAATNAPQRDFKSS